MVARARESGEGELSEDELQLRVDLECGPLPSAAFIQERVMQHMPTSHGDMRDVRDAARHSWRAPKRAEPQPKRLAANVDTTQPHRVTRSRSECKRARLPQGSYALTQAGAH